LNKNTTPSRADTAPVWSITGCSTGFALEPARQAIERGDRTVVTARDPAKLHGAITGDQAAVPGADFPKAAA
jgi:hypothetical protein